MLDSATWRVRVNNQCIMVMQPYVKLLCQLVISLWCSDSMYICYCTCTHTHPFNCPLSRTTRVNRYQKGKTYLDFTEARDSEWQWHQLGHMQVCTLIQRDSRASTSPLSFLPAGCPSCRPANSDKALKAGYRLRHVCQLLCVH